MKKLLCFAILFTGVARAQINQFPVAEMPNAVLVCTEVQNCVVTKISIPNAVVQYGLGTTWDSPITSPALPITVSCAHGCPALGNDPLSGTPKDLVAQQQSVAYTVTLLSGTVVTIPASGAPPVVTPPIPPVAGTNTITFSIVETVNGQNVTATCVAPVVSK